MNNKSFILLFFLTVLFGINPITFCLFVLAVAIKRYWRRQLNVNSLRKMMLYMTLFYEIAIFIRLFYHQEVEVTYNPFLFIPHPLYNNSNQEEIIEEEEEEIEDTIPPYYNQMDAQKHCLICLNDILDLNSARNLPCFHLFHSECIENWVKIKRNCPTCRRKV